VNKNKYQFCIWYGRGKNVRERFCYGAMIKIGVVNSSKSKKFPCSNTAEGWPYLFSIKEMIGFGG